MMIAERRLTAAAVFHFSDYCQKRKISSGFAFGRSSLLKDGLQLRKHIHTRSPEKTIIASVGRQHGENLTHFGAARGFAGLHQCRCFL
jgi:hypothetical protein